jgi:hypothetical protein
MTSPVHRCRSGRALTTALAVPSALCGVLLSMSGAASLLATAALASVAVTAPAAAMGVNVSVQAGVLTVEDDAGASTDVLVAPYSDPRPDYPPFYSVITKETGTGQTTVARAGAGCSQLASSVSCPYPSIQAIVVAAGDGADRVTIGISGAGGPGTGQVCTVPVTVDAGGGDDTTGVSCAGQPVVLHGGDGNDQLSAPAAASSVQEDGGAGDDALGVYAGVDGNGDQAPIGAIHPASVVLDGGPGDDRLGYVGQGSATVRGGEGNDSIGVWRTTDSIDARGEAGNDTMAVMENRGPVLVDAGDGDDNLSISRTDVDESRVGGGIVDARAGAGDDTLLVGDDGDMDLIDCGPGNDHFDFYLEGQTSPPRENRYDRCPIVGARLMGTASVSRAGNALVFDFRSPEPGTVRLSLLGPRSRLGQATARLRRGHTRVSVSLNRAGRRHLRGRYRDRVVVQAAIRSRTGDAQPVTRAVHIRRAAS